jgi:hypothetical protein
MNCLNCGTKLSCGCQKRVATDGKNACSICLPAYETKVKAAKVAGTSVPNTPPNKNIIYQKPS